MPHLHLNVNSILNFIQGLEVVRCIYKSTSNRSTDLHHHTHKIELSLQNILYIKL